MKLVRREKRIQGVCLRLKDSTVAKLRKLSTIYNLSMAEIVEQALESVEE
jgi:hypothetical protein